MKTERVRGYMKKLWFTPASTKNEPYPKDIYGERLYAIDRHGIVWVTEMREFSHEFKGPFQITGFTAGDVTKSICAEFIGIYDVSLGK